MAGDGRGDPPHRRGSHSARRQAGSAAGGSSAKCRGPRTRADAGRNGPAELAARRDEPAAPMAAVSVDHHVHARDALTVGRGGGARAVVFGGCAGHVRARVGRPSTPARDPRVRSRAGSRAALRVDRPPEGCVTPDGVPGAPGSRAPAAAAAGRSTAIENAPFDGPRVRRVLAQQLELGDMAGGEMPGSRMELEHLQAVGRARVDPVIATRDQRLGAGRGVDVPQPRGDVREAAGDVQVGDHGGRTEQRVAAPVAAGRR